MTTSTQRTWKRIVRNRPTEIFINWQFDLNTRSWKWKSDDSRIREIFNTNWIVNALYFSHCLLTLTFTLHLESKVDIFLKSVFRNVGSNRQCGMTIDEINWRCFRISQKPVSRNEHITLNGYLRVLSIDDTVKRLHYLDPSLTIRVSTWNNVRVSSNGIVLNGFGVDIIQNWISFDIFHIDIVIIFFSNLIISMCDDVVSIKVDTPLRIELVFSKRFHYTHVFYLMIVQDMEFGYFCW